VTYGSETVRASAPRSRRACGPDGYRDDQRPSRPLSQFTQFLVVCRRLKHAQDASSSRVMEVAKNTQLRGLPEAALEFGEARELGQREHGVPQRDGFLVIGNAGNHRAKKRHAIGWCKRNDRGTHVTASAAEGKGGLSVKFGIPPGVIRGCCKFDGQPNGV